MDETRIYTEIAALQWRIVGLGDALEASMTVWRQCRDSGDLIGLDAVTQVDMRVYQAMYALRDRVATLHAELATARNGGVSS
jgi:hypothetical protein